MAGYIIGAVLVLLVVFVAILLVRTLLFVPRELPPVQQDTITVDREKIVNDMISMIQCKTVSNRDDALVDWGEYKKFQELLRERFPLVHQHCTLEHVGKTGLLYHWQGKSAQEPSVCMAHYDVVPIDEEGWDKPAFEGILEDGYIWGRGTLDTKGTLCGVMEAAEQLLSEGYVPAHDVYFSFSGEEEIDGDSCKEIVRYLEQHGIRPALVLDEGGAVVENSFPGVSQECAMVGIGEKGSVNMDFVIESQGGHASTPPPHTILGQLSEAVTRIERSPFRRQLTKPVQEMFDTLGRYSTFAYRLIFANLWCFLPLLDIICKKSGGELNAMMRSTVAVTRMEGSKAYNVLPPKASFGINMRLMGEDTIDYATSYLQKVIGNDAIQPQLVNGMNPSIYSDTSCDAWDKVVRVIHNTWPEAVAVSYTHLTLPTKA